MLRRLRCRQVSWPAILRWCTDSLCLRAKSRSSSCAPCTGIHPAQAEDSGQDLAVISAQAARVARLLRRRGQQGLDHVPQDIAAEGRSYRSLLRRIWHRPGNCRPSSPGSPSCQSFLIGPLVYISPLFFPKVIQHQSTTAPRWPGHPGAVADAACPQTETCVRYRVPVNHGDGDCNE